MFTFPCSVFEQIDCSLLFSGTSFLLLSAWSVLYRTVGWGDGEDFKFGTVKQE